MGSLNYVTFMLITHALSNSLQEKSHAITSTRNHFHVSKPIVWVFDWNSLIQNEISASS